MFHALRPSELFGIYIMAFVRIVPSSKIDLHVFASEDALGLPPMDANCGQLSVVTTCVVNSEYHFKAEFYVQPLNYSFVWNMTPCLLCYCF